MTEFVDSDLYFVQDKNNFINPLLQPDPDPLKKVPDPDSAGQKSTDPDPLPCKKKQKIPLFYLLDQPVEKLLLYPSLNI